VLAGRYCRLEPLDASRHAADLYAANSLDREGRMWTYLFSGPFSTLEEFTAWLKPREDSLDPLFFTVVDLATGRATGIASYLRIDTAHGVIEVGHLAFSPLLQRTRAATEAMYLMMKRAFELGYRRYEWKCDALNSASRHAAERLGFEFEGIFRQAVIYKGRNRDTAWFSVIDSEWPKRETAFLSWLDPANFDSHGRQLRRLHGD
jgi:RimJ/RimL family protein N-acetyltransferase